MGLNQTEGKGKQWIKIKTWGQILKFLDLYKL